MKFGVNYTPSHGWFHAWLDPDWVSIDHDLQQIASLGLDHVRIFPIWPYLQPNRTLINHKAVADVRRMVHIAGEHGLDAYVDIFQGHLSSFDFLPSWLVTWHATNMFTQPEALAAQQQLVRVMRDELIQEPSFRGITLGNEVNQFSDRPHPTKMSATSQEINLWIDSLLSEAKTESTKSLYSVNDGTWFIDGHPFTPVQSANKGDITTIHAWVFNGVAQGYGPTSFECLSYAQYLAQLSLAFAQNPDRQVWLQEIGAPENVLARQFTPDFCEETVTRMLDNDHLWGITWWCSHDVSSQLSDFPEFEHALGLFDERGNIKSIGETFAELTQKYKNTQIVQPRNIALVIETDEQGEPLSRSQLAPGGSVFESWMKYEKEGKRPTLISSQLSKNMDYLSARGISELVPISEHYGGKFYTAVSDPSFEN